jgi:2-dehydropantoate 2-reductase
MDTGVVLPACVFVGVHVEEPGTIVQKGGSGTILFGKDPKHPELIPENVFKLFEKAGIKYQWLDDPRPAIWEKYIFIAPFALVTAYSGKTLGEVMTSQQLKGQVKDIMGEVALIAAHEGVDLGDALIEESLEKANGFPYETKTSFQRDYEQKGKPHEADLFGGTILRLGKKHGIPTPATERIYAYIQSRSLLC